MLSEAQLFFSVFSFETYKLVQTAILRERSSDFNTVHLNHTHFDQRLVEDKGQWE